MAKILVVDDTHDDLLTMKELLEKEGHQVITFSDSTKALKELKKDGFDLILLNIIMPSLSGLDLLNIIKEKKEHHIPIVLVSIMPKKEIDTAQINGFIQKPFSPNNFLRTVRKVLKG